MFSFYHNVLGCVLECFLGSDTKSFKFRYFFWVYKVFRWFLCLFFIVLSAWTCDWFDRLSWFDRPSWFDRLTNRGAWGTKKRIRPDAFFLLGYS